MEKTLVKELTAGLDEKRIQSLTAQAFQAREKAYCPYSGFAVGAALLAENGLVYTGCNIENAAYSPSNCAERTACFKAVSEGVREFKAIAITGGKQQLKAGRVDFCAPCGVCRQVLLEFCSKDMPVILAKDIDDYQIYSLGELTPLGFSAESLI